MSGCKPKERAKAAAGSTGVWLKNVVLFDGGATLRARKARMGDVPGEWILHNATLEIRINSGSRTGTK